MYSIYPSIRKIGEGEYHGINIEVNVRRSINYASRGFVSHLVSNVLNGKYMFGNVVIN